MEKFVSYFDERLHQIKLSKFPYTVYLADLDNYYDKHEDKLEELFGKPYISKEKNGFEIVEQDGKWFLFEHEGPDAIHCHFKTQEDAMIFRLLM